MNINEIESFGKLLAPSLKRLIEEKFSNSEARFNEKAKETDSKLEAFKTELKDFTAEFIAAEMIAEFKKFPVPEKGDKGDSVTIEHLAPVIEEIANKCTSLIEEQFSVAIAKFETLQTEDLELNFDDLKTKLNSKFEDFAIKYNEEAETAIQLYAKEKVDNLGESLTLKLTEEFAEFQKTIVIPEPKLEKGDKGDSITLDDVAPIIAEIEKRLSEQFETKVADIEKAHKENLKAMSDSFSEFLVSKAEEAKEIYVQSSTALEKAVSFQFEEFSKSIVLPVPEKATNGKDALQLEILPCIDLEKSYHRGIYAKHNNGLWRSYETTSKLRGWECIVNGVNSVEVKSENERNFTIEITNSSGEPLVKEFSLPVMIYRNVYKEKGKYETGDVVTYAGSTWHSNVDENISKPGTNLDWTLTVKKGRDYKEPVNTNKRDTSKGVSVK